MNTNERLIAQPLLSVIQAGEALSRCGQWEAAVGVSHNAPYKHFKLRSLF